MQSAAPPSLAVTPDYADRQGFARSIEFFNSYSIFETQQRRSGGQVATFDRIPIQLQLMNGIAGQAGGIIGVPG